MKGSQCELNSQTTVLAGASWAIAHAIYLEESHLHPSKVDIGLLKVEKSDYVGHR